jgi:myo-inositol 2-dehydrogenase/D-chiro-inositol 1-dehydrogenase
MGELIRLALLGAGRIGRVHAVNLARHLPGAVLDCIADVDLAAAQRLAAELGVACVCADPLEALSRPEVDGVVICTSTDTHVPLVVAAAERGKHVFCEKPLALDLRGTDEALAAVARAGVKLQVGFNRRFDSGFARARELVRSGQLGRVRLVRITSRDPQPPPLHYALASGGIFRDMTIHDFDMARFVAGQETESVFASGACLVSQEVAQAGDVDTAVVLLRFESGAMAVIDNCRHAAYGYDQRLEVFGDKGAVVVDNARSNPASLWDEAGLHQDRPPFFFLERYARAYRDEMEAFVRCIRHDEEPPVTGADARAALVLALAAARSLQEERPVRVAEVAMG